MEGAGRGRKGIAGNRISGRNRQEGEPGKETRKKNREGKSGENQAN